MSIRRLSLLIFVFIPVIMLAQVKYFEISPTAAPTQFSINVDHPDCGQIVVYSSLPRLVFESNMAGIQETKYHALESKYVIFLRPIRQKIVVKSPGFIEAELWGPGTPRAKDVVEYFSIEERNPDPDKVSIFSVTFKITPPDAMLKVDNREYDVSKPVMLKPGTYELEVSKPGFVSQSKQVAVSAERAFFEVNLKAQDLLTLTIRSTPSDAEITLNNVAEGRTPRQFFRFPGSYRLRLAKTGFETIEEEINVTESGDNTYNFSLVKATVSLSISLDPPDATLLINNEEVTGTSFELAPGQYKLEARKSGYDPMEKRIELQRDQDITERITLQKATVSLSISLDPPDATLLINNEEVTGTSFELAPGQYKLEARKSGYDPMEKRIELRKGTGSIENLKLTRQTGRLLLTVDPIDANLSLSDGSIWTGARITSLPVGEYSLSASLKGYQTLQRSFKIEKDKDTTLDIVLEIKSTQSVTSDQTRASITNMILVDGGDIHSGSTKVALSTFYIGKYEVTQKEWKTVMGKNPSHFKGDMRPVENITWFDAVEYCNRRSMQEGLTPCYSFNSYGTNPDDWPKKAKKSKDNYTKVACNSSANGYRLPNELEWIFAAKGGSLSKGYTYSGSNNINNVAWNRENAGLGLPGGYNDPEYGTHVVGQKAPNELGIYDMSGNVWEWCWGMDAIENLEPAKHSAGCVAVPVRIARGGGYNYNSSYGRYSNDSPYKYEFTGLRVARKSP